ncbi:MAG: sulfotransferase [Chloroflexota bacterium]|nr:sulfotransferase [Chloroflexota bacterium]
MRQDDPRPTPITPLNIGWWAARTWWADRRRHRRHRRPLSAHRLAASLRPDLRRPIFVIGADRSGTSFLGDSLGVLPEVSYHHEPVATKAAARYVYEGRWSFRRARAFFRLVYAWLLRANLEGDLRLAEKTPTNSFIVGFLARAFPDGVFVHIVRDGRDAARSHLQQPWLLAASLASGHREPGGYRYGPDARFWVEPARRREFETTTDLHRCIWSWRRHTEAALAGGGDLPPSRYHELRYESLVVDPRAEGERLLDFLAIDAPASRAALLGHLERADARGVGAWRETLGADEMAIIEREAGTLLRRLGYDSSA